MYRYSLVICIIVYFTAVESTCPTPAKFYVDCSTTRSLSSSVQLCAKYGMTLVNLTNSSTLTIDVSTLNQTLVSSNCTNYFWFASGNTTGYVASVSSLATVLQNLLGGVGLLVGAVLNLVSCLLLICPVTTTPAPITVAVTVCTRPIQQQVIQKCQAPVIRTDMRSFQFSTQQMYGGVLSSFSTGSLTICSGLCSDNTQCIGISYIGGICYLYM